MPNSNVKAVSDFLGVEDVEPDHVNDQNKINDCVTDIILSLEREGGGYEQTAEIDNNLTVLNLTMAGDYHGDVNHPLSTSVTTQFGNQSRGLPAAVPPISLSSPPSCRLRLRARIDYRDNRGCKSAMKKKFHQ